MRKVLGGRAARALAYGKSVGFLVVRFLGFPKSIEELFGKRSGNGEKMRIEEINPLKSKVCRDEAERGFAAKPLGEPPAYFCRSFLLLFFR